MDALPALVQALPAELFNEIYHLTFNPPSSRARFIDRNSKPPTCLQVNRSTRETLAESYYGSGTVLWISKKLATRYMRSLPPTHRRLISDLRIFDAEAVVVAISGAPFPLVRVDFHGMLSSDSWTRDIHLALDDDVVKAKVVITGRGHGWATFSAMKGLLSVQDLLDG